MAASLWDGHPSRVASMLLSAECWTGMRRHFARNRIPPPAGWIEERADYLGHALTTVHIKPVDEEVIENMKREPELAECRTLDALHLATALTFRGKGDQGLLIVSFDERMRQTARKLDFEVLPP